MFFFCYPNSITFSCNEGIYVSNTPGAVDDATATTALYLLISTLRQFSLGERSLRALTWKPPTTAQNAHDPTGRTLAILGLGGIGLRFAELAHAFPMRIIYHSRHKVAHAPAWCEYFENVVEMLGQADVLSVHVPLRSDTVGLVGEKWIRALKKGAIIINTARGKVIDEEAMIKALEDGHVSRGTCCYLIWRRIAYIFSYSSPLSVSMCILTSHKSTFGYLNSLGLRSSRTWAPKIRTLSAGWRSAL
jgi:lactate dehydrogenase-like 2-hydroxyacid dehydrogenase